MTRVMTALAATLVLLSGTGPADAAVPERDLERIADAAPEHATATPDSPRSILVFTLCKGFRHGSIPWATAMLETLAAKTGAFTVTVSDDPEVFRPESLARFDAVCMNNTTGTLFTDAALRASFLSFVRSGKGLIGIHAATDCFYDWHEYGEMLGGYFNAHPWNERVGVKIDDPTHPLNAAFAGKGFSIADEIYQFKEPYSRDRQRVLLSLDVSRTDMGKKNIRRTDNDFAVSWIRAYGKGRVFYCSLGHRNNIFWTPSVVRHYLDGIQFALGDLPADVTPIPLSPRSVDPVMGTYRGTLRRPGRAPSKATAQVIAEGNGAYRAVVTAQDGSRFEMSTTGTVEGTQLEVRTSDAEDAARGASYEYYEGRFDRLPDFSKLTPTRTGTSPYIGLWPQTRDDDYALRFSAHIRIEKKGTYTFYTSSDDGSRLMIDGRTVVDNDGLHGKETVRGRIALSRGSHRVDVTFFEKSGDAVLEVGMLDTEYEGAALTLTGSAGTVQWSGQIDGDTFTATASGPDGGELRLAYDERVSPTLGKRAPEGARVLLSADNGSPPSLDGWKNKRWEALPDGSMRVVKGDQRSAGEFGSMRLHLEFMIPFMPTARGQGRGNSGVYIQDRYEVQVLDSFGLDSKDNDCGGIYKVARPLTNACLPPLRWQTYDIDFAAARFAEDGSVAANPRITVRHNGTVIHDDVEIPHPTGGAAGKSHVKRAPLRLQDHGNPVRYRNIWIVETDR